MKNNFTNEQTIKKTTGFTFWLIIGGLILYGWIIFQSTDSLFTKLFLLIVLITFVLPISFEHLKLSLGFNSKNKKETINNINMAFNSSHCKKTIVPKYKTKVIDNENYKLLRNTITTCIQNRVFNRKDVVILKNEINHLLGSNTDHYNSMNFQNDLHEIYTKIKSSHFSDDQYLHLLRFINSEILDCKIGDD